MIQVGDIVHYRLTEDQEREVNRRRSDATINLPKVREAKPGFQLHVGCQASADCFYPMIVVAYLQREGALLLSGQVLLPGNDQLWVEDVLMGKLPGEWSSRLNALGGN
jgi:hypothetical protein